MRILIATIIKDLKILLRDRVGLFMMFFMPILLVIVITSVQNSTFELVNNNKISLIIFNKDKGKLGAQLITGIRKIGMFNLKTADSTVAMTRITSLMYDSNALVALVVPAGFSKTIENKAEDLATRALKDPDSVNANPIWHSDGGFTAHVLPPCDATGIQAVCRRSFPECGSGNPGRNNCEKTL